MDMATPSERLGDIVADVLEVHCVQVRLVPELQVLNRPDETVSSLILLAVIGLDRHGRLVKTPRPGGHVRIGETEHSLGSLWFDHAEPRKNWLFTGPFHAELVLLVSSRNDQAVSHDKQNIRFVAVSITACLNRPEYTTILKDPSLYLSAHTTGPVNADMDIVVRDNKKLRATNKELRAINKRLCEELETAKEVARERQEEMYEALSRCDVAQTDLEETQAELEQARAELEETRTQLEQVQAELEQARVQLEQVQAEQAQDPLELVEVQAEWVEVPAEIAQLQAELAQVLTELAQVRDKVWAKEHANSRELFKRVMGEKRQVQKKNNDLLLNFKKAKMFYKRFERNVTDPFWADP